MKNKNYSKSQNIAKSLAFFELELKKHAIAFLPREELINAKIDKRDKHGHHWLNLYLYYSEKGEVLADLIGSAIKKQSLNPNEAIGEFITQKNIYNLGSEDSE